MTDIRLEALPPEEAIEFFRQKGYAIGFDWRDVWQEEHQAAFTVAKAMQLDILRDIRAGVDDALANGTTFSDFRRELEPTLVRKGWWGRAEMVDPESGEAREVQLGSTRRLKTIYDTNLRTAHAEGQWERIQASRDSFPYLMYSGNNSEHPRLEHSSWDGLVLPADDPWWESHMPVRAWGCKCRVIQMTRRQVERQQRTVDKAPADVTYTYTNRRTGEIQRIPKGVDPAFHYPPGGRRRNLPVAVTEKIIQAPASAEIAVQDRLLVGRKARRHEAAGDALTREEWEALPAGLANPRAVLYDTIEKNLLYVFDAPGERVQKLVVRPDFIMKKQKSQMNVARTAFKLKSSDLAAGVKGGRYRMVRGEIE